jgi:hypothetical protein
MASFSMYLHGVVSSDESIPLFLEYEVVVTQLRHFLFTIV